MPARESLGARLSSLETQIGRSRAAPWITAFVLAIAAFAIARRFVTVAVLHAQLSILDYAGIMASLVLTILTCRAVFSRRYRRGAALMIAQSVLTFFVLAQVEVPFTKIAGPWLADNAAITYYRVREWAAPDTATKERFAIDRFVLADDPPFNGPHERIVDRYVYGEHFKKSCTTYAADRATAHDPVLKYAFAHGDGYCKAQRADVAGAVIAYTNATADEPESVTSDLRMIRAAALAVNDGYPLI